jgi:hypothetical protein
MLFATSIKRQLYNTKSPAWAKQKKQLCGYAGIKNGT